METTQTTLPAVTPNIKLPVPETKETAELRILLANPKVFYSNTQISTIHDAFTCVDLSIGGISRSLGDMDHLRIRALLNIMIGDIVLSINVGKTMSPGQITETVSLIVKHYHHLKVKDFKLCFEGVKLGNYGNLYDRIDGQVLLSWLKEYDLQRDYVAAEINYNRSELFKMQGAALLLPEKSVIETGDDVFKTNVARLRKTLADNKISREKAAEIKKQESRAKSRDPMYMLSQRWLQQFDDLHYLRPVKVKAFRFIKRYGRIVDINAYLVHKQWQFRLTRIDRTQRLEFYLLKYPK